MIKIQKYRRFFFGSDQALSSEQLDQFIDTFSQPSNDDVSVLGGREPIKRITLQDNTHAVIKHYLRGGIIHLFNKQYYLRTQGLRCRKEYELFRLVRNLGVNAPEPLVFAYSGLIFYRAWVITREIQGARSLAEISINDSERAKSVMGALINQVEILLDNHKSEIMKIIKEQNYDNYVTGGGTNKTDSYYKNKKNELQIRGVFWKVITKTEETTANFI